MVQLVPMSKSEYQAFRSRSVREFAEEKVAAGAWKADDAPALSEAAFRRFLPGDQETDGAYLFNVKENDQLTSVGHLWFNVMEQEKGPVAFILDILIYEEFQGKGYGQATMTALEEKVRELGLNTIGLHVFGHNQRAYQLYQKMGYIVTDIQMSKTLEDRG
ncbi:GNAT family N-acetyltransferase [Paenibacillus timonensis]|nr:GNAT family N-acetyltransferase [Paenibacillus timonensis]MUG87952.1 GNAT family N-acetyltransferase [Paenibacillus timonensis]